MSERYLHADTMIGKAATVRSLMPYRTLRAAFSVVLLAFLASTRAAEIKSVCDLEDAKGMGCTIVLSGEIKSGDAKKLRHVLTSNRKRTGSFRFLLLDSPGGDVAEALKIGELVKSALLSTTLTRLADLDNDDGGSSRQCVSACFLVLVAGGERIIHRGRLGVHRPYFDAATYRAHTPLEIAKGQQRIEEEVRTFSRANGVSEHLIARMMEHSSRQVYWLGSDEIQSIERESTWFQELLIAACGWDHARHDRFFDEGAKAASASDRAWVSKIYDCLSDQVEKAQVALAR